MFFGTARTSIDEYKVNESMARECDILLSGICTKKSFLHSFGFVMCAGTNGY